MLCIKCHLKFTSWPSTKKIESFEMNLSRNIVESWSIVVHVSLLKIKPIYASESNGLKSMKSDPLKKLFQFPRKWSWDINANDNIAFQLLSSICRVSLYRESSQRYCLVMLAIVSHQELIVLLSSLRSPVFRKLKAFLKSSTSKDALIG